MFFFNLLDPPPPQKKKTKKITQLLQNCIGPTIRNGQESWCLPYAGFFLVMMYGSVLFFTPCNAIFFCLWPPLVFLAQIRTIVVPESSNSPNCVNCNLLLSSQLCDQTLNLRCCNTLPHLDSPLTNFKSPVYYTFIGLNLTYVCKKG